MAVRGSCAQGGGVPLDAAALDACCPAPRRQLRDWLPEGRALAPHEFASRHRVVCALLVLHLPFVLVAEVVTGASLGQALLDLVPLALLAVLAVLPGSRRRQAIAATVALLSCSAVLVHLFDGRAEVSYHYFVVVAIVALYQDWLVYVTAIAFVGVQQVLAASGYSAFAGDARSWGSASLQAAFVLAESAVLVVFWHANEQSRADQERALCALSDGQSSVQARLEDADRMRADLIGTVSHEFRTPLTGIRGAALTLLKRGSRLDEEGRQQLLRAVLDQQERLSRLLENMLVAARATATDPEAVAEVDAVAAEVAMLSGAAAPDRPSPSVVVQPGTLARIDRHALHQVLANLVDNAHRHGAPGAVPIVAGGRDAEGVWVTVSNEGSSVDGELARRLFEPFTQADSGPTRGTEGLGMGLYVVRRLVEVYGGTASVDSEVGWTTVQVRLAAVS